MRPIGLRFLKAASFVSVVLIGTVLLFELFTGMALQWVEALRLGFLIFALFGLMFGTIVYFTWQSYRQPKNAIVFQERWFAFDDDAFELTTANGIFSRVPWTAVVSAKHQDRTTLLNVSAGQSIAIPDGVLSPEGQAKLLDRVARLPG